ncbi:hypothetical protein [Azospirillum sp. B506]|nr:hypothetical protein [Azospirillum sp. B506]
MSESGAKQGVSVIIAAHRAHDTIARAVQSLLEQALRGGRR